MSEPAENDDEPAEKPERDQIKRLAVELPSGFMNVHISAGDLIADTNDSANWDTLRFPLPPGNWNVYTQRGKLVELIDSPLPEPEANQ